MSKLNDIIELLGEEKDSNIVQFFLKDQDNLPFETSSDELADRHIFPNIGIGFNIDAFNKTLDTIFFFNSEKFGTTTYKGDLPLGLKFEFSQERAKDILGEPNEYKSAYKLRNIEWNPWDKYYLNDYDLRIQYNKDKTQIEKVTIMTPDAVKHNNN